MIKYNVGELIECASGVYIITEAKTDCLPWAQKYKVVSQSGEVKQVNLFQITHRNI